MGVYRLSFLFLSYFAMDLINFHTIISAFSYEQYVQFSENNLSVVSFVPRVTIVRYNLPRKDCQKKVACEEQYMHKV